MAFDTMAQQIPTERPMVMLKGWAGFWDRWRWPIAITVEILTVLLVWDVLIARLQVVNPFFFPAPSNIFWELVDLVKTGALWKHLSFSLRNVAVGYTAGATIGILLGMLIGTVRALDKLWGPIVWTAYATPIIIIRPLLIIWFGFGWEALAFLIGIATMFPILITIAAGVHTVDPFLLRAARVFGASRLHLYTKVLLPSLVPFIVTGFRLSIAPALIGMLVGEMVGSNIGLGYIIQMGATSFRMSQSFVAVMILVAMSLTLVNLVRLFEDWVAPWRKRKQGA